MGAVAGAVLSFAQWLALRKKVARAGWWIPANMLAWLAGMPIIFWGIDAAQKSQPLWQATLLLTGILVLTGAVVGALHGVVLVRLVGQNRLERVL
jgi:peptidoglycan/LPS O-acetylase OafA/YrhL